MLEVHVKARLRRAISPGRATICGFRGRRKKETGRETRENHATSANVSLECVKYDTCARKSHDRRSPGALFPRAHTHTFIDSVSRDTFASERNPNVARANRRGRSSTGVRRRDCRKEISLSETCHTYLAFPAWTLITASRLIRGRSDNSEAASALLAHTQARAHSAETPHNPVTREFTSPPALFSSKLAPYYATLPGGQRDACTRAQVKGRVVTRRFICGALRTRTHTDSSTLHRRIARSDMKNTE